uniref:Uncharacterized protein n=1 Tax=Romanomermis culicivorax TaxID=13658 RepID=A0A915IJK4_ROMCU
MDVEAVGGNKAVVKTVVVGADVRAVSGSDVVIGGSNAAVEVACSMFIGGAGSNRTLKIGLGGFFKASKLL